MGGDAVTKLPRLVPGIGTETTSHDQPSETTLTTLEALVEAPTSYCNLRICCQFRLSFSQRRLLPQLACALSEVSDLRSGLRELQSSEVSIIGA